MIEVRINQIQLAKPGRAEKGNHPSQVLSAWQIVDADSGHSMGAGLWVSRDHAETECKRKRWRVKPQEMAA